MLHTFSYDGGTYIIPRAWFLTYSGETKRLHYFRLHFTHTHYICNCCMTSIYYIFAVCKNYDAKDAYVTALHDLHWSVHLLFICLCVVAWYRMYDSHRRTLVNYFLIKSFQVKHHALSLSLNLKQWKKEKMRDYCCYCQNKSTQLSILWIILFSNSDRK